VRSRNGNRPFVFTSLAVICTLSYGADYYYIGYRLITKNIQPVDEYLTVSKAMQPCTGQTFSTLSFNRASGESLESVLQRERTRFLEFSSPEPFRLKSDLSLSGNRMQALQTLTLPTQCYAVEFNDESVTISQLK